MLPPFLESHLQPSTWLFHLYFKHSITQAELAFFSLLIHNQIYFCFYI